MLPESIEIVQFKAEYQKIFYEMNKSFIEDYSFMDDYDYRVLKDPENEVIAKGGQVFVALADKEPVAFLGIVPKAKGAELVKFIVHEQYRKQGLGHKLIEEALVYAKQKQWSPIMAETSSKLQSSIRFFEQHGFKKITQQSSDIERVDTWLELII